MQNLFQSSLFGSSNEAASGAAWGGITGSLSSQTDLQSALDAKLNLTGGTLTGALTVSSASGESLLLQKAGTSFFRARDSGLVNGAVLECIGSAYGGQLVLSSQAGGCFIGRRDTTSLLAESNFEAFIGSYNGSGVNIRGTGSYAFGPTTGANLHSTRNAAFYYGGAVNTIQMGANHASVASTQIFKAHNVTSGAGADLHLKGGAGSTVDGYVRVGTASGGLAFFGTGGRSQPIGDNNSNVTAAGGGSGSVHADTEFDGGAGGGSYTIGGIVKMLKELGLFS